MSENKLTNDAFTLLSLCSVLFCRLQSAELNGIKEKSRIDRESIGEGSSRQSVTTKKVKVAKEHEMAMRMKPYFLPFRTITLFFEPKVRLPYQESQQ